MILFSTRLGLAVEEVDEEAMNIAALWPATSAKEEREYLKTHLFLDNQMPQEIINGRNLWSGSLHLSHQDFRASLQLFPTQKKSTSQCVRVYSQNFLAKGQKMNKWSIVSSTSLHRQHHPGPLRKRFCRESHVDTFRKTMFQENNLEFAGKLSSHRALYHHYLFPSSLVAII